MYFLSFIILLVAGILGAAGLIIKKKPEAAELLNKMAAWQGWLGVVLVIWGIWDLIQSFTILAWLPVLGIFALATAIVEIILGLLLGWGLIAKYTGGGGEKGAAMIAKLVPFQAIFGILAICLALFWLLVGFGLFNFLIVPRI